MSREIHQLKTWPKYFEAVRRGTKLFEIREADRDFRIGDILLLMEWDPHTADYTGQSFTTGPIVYIALGEPFLPQATCVLGLSAPTPERVIEWKPARDIGWAISQMKEGRDVRRKHWAAGWRMCILDGVSGEKPLLLSPHDRCMDWANALEDVTETDWELVAIEASA